MRLAGKVAIVTGGGSGIGQETATLFARQGARVLVADARGEAAEAVARASRNAGHEARAASADVSEPGQVDRMVRAALDAFGGIDVLVNGAGVLAFGTVLGTDLAVWQRVLAINLTGVYLCSRAVLPHMIARGGGAIVNVSSSTGAHDARATSRPTWPRKAALRS